MQAGAFFPDGASHRWGAAIVMRLLEGNWTSHMHIRSALKPKRIADVVGLRILADEDWKETRAELKKINKDTLDRLEKSY